MRSGIALVCALMLWGGAIGSDATDESLPSREDSRALPVPEAKPGEFPYHAYIAGEDEWVYSGALITPNAVLTVGEPMHRYTRFAIYMGFVERLNPGKGYWITESSLGIAHPESIDNEIYCNIGIIFLSENAPRTRFIQPVPLPSPEEAFDCFTLYPAMMPGWGNDTVVISDRLRWIHLDVVESSVCVRHYGKETFTQSMLCAAKQNAQICGSDMGAPLVVRSDHDYKLIGVATFYGGKLCSAPGPHIFIRVTSFLEWIESTTGKYKLP